MFEQCGDRAPGVGRALGVVMRPLLGIAIVSVLALATPALARADEGSAPNPRSTNVVVVDDEPPPASSAPSLEPRADEQPVIVVSPARMADPPRPDLPRVDLVRRGVGTGLTVFGLLCLGGGGGVLAAAAGPGSNGLVALIAAIPMGTGAILSAVGIALIATSGGSAPRKTTPTATVPRVGIAPTRDGFAVGLGGEF